ncbi:MAG: agmatine deiminase family protein [Kofleriaceae bacterium]|nr:agmatine deiminase family protein [Kofleriaceae bacterium]
MFVVGPGSVAAACFEFNGWGGSYVMPGDTARWRRGWRVAPPACRRGRRASSWGGAIEVDGEGTVLTARQCLLGGAGARPGSREAAMSSLLCAALGAERVICARSRARRRWAPTATSTPWPARRAPAWSRPAGPGARRPQPRRPRRRPRRPARATDARGSRRLEVVTVRLARRGPRRRRRAHARQLPELLPSAPRRGWCRPTARGADADAVAAVAALFPGRATTARRRLAGAGRRRRPPLHHPARNPRT